MAVIVDYDLVVELLALHAKSIWPVGAMTNDYADYCIHRYLRCSPWLTRIGARVIGLQGTSRWRATDGRQHDAGT